MSAAPDNVTDCEAATAENNPLEQLNANVENECGEANKDANEHASEGTAEMTLFSLVQNPNKAGTGMRSREEIEEIVQKACKNSKYYAHHQIRAKKINEQIAELKRRASQETKQDIERSAKFVQTVVEALLPMRDFSRVIVHVDMDAFYASVEELDRPDLKDKPMGVGGTGNGGTLTTANYVARKFGVRSAMATYIAKALCPELIILPPCFEKYRHYSGLVRKVFEKYHPLYTPASLDEAYLDITDYLEAHPETTAEAIVEQIRKEIFEATALTASAGVACNRMIAKVCSDKNKPNGQFMVASTPEAVLEFLQPLPIRKIPGIGEVCEKQLRAFGVETCGDLTDKLPLLRLILGQSLFSHCVEISIGLASTDVNRKDDISKGLGRERTNSRMKTVDGMLAELRRAAKDVELEMDKNNLAGRCVTLKMKHTDYKLISRSKTLDYYISTAEKMLEVAEALLAAYLQANPSTQLRLIGVRMTGLEYKSDIEKRTNVLQSSIKEQEAFKEDDPPAANEDQPTLTESDVTTDEVKQDPTVQVRPIHCPECGVDVTWSDITTHLIRCLEKKGRTASSASHHFIGTNFSSKQLFCPVCTNLVEATLITTHVLACMDKQDQQRVQEPAPSNPTVVNSFSTVFEEPNRQQSLNYPERLEPIHINSHVQVKQELAPPRATPNYIDCILCNAVLDTDSAESHLEECFVKTKYPDTYPAWLKRKRERQQLQDSPPPKRANTSSSSSPVSNGNSNTQNEQSLRSSSKVSKINLPSRTSPKRGNPVTSHHGISKFFISKAPEKDVEKHQYGYSVSDLEGTNVAFLPCCVCERLIPEPFLSDHVDWCLMQPAERQ
ncbi:hypothetical protein HDU81_006659 [Chytriomyces hyalinus]|nr:hypothetical protein HDU81_006659 [Chytriomyces hyalinus]